jgi:hypothetical protein
MKTKIITALLCMSCMSSSMAGDARDITRDTLYTNKPTHVWTNLDGTKTYSADSPGRTTFDTRCAQRVARGAQFQQDLAMLAVGVVIAGVKALYEWWNTSQPVMINISR